MDSLDSGVPLTGEKTRQLLQRVKGRLKLDSVVRRTYTGLLVAGGLYLLILLVSRLLGVIPNVFSPPTLLAPLGLAVIIGLAFHKRFSDLDAARMADQGADTKDLFLTSTLIEKSPAEYKAIVVDQAERRSSDVAPDQVVPYAWLPQARNAAILMGVLGLAVLFTPQLDPFGKDKAREQVTELKKDLEEIKKARTIRKAELQKKGVDQTHSKETKVAMDKLRETFRTVKPTEQRQNLNRLQDNQKELGQLWKERSDRKLKDSISKSMSKQQFGMMTETTQDWKQELENGKIDKVMEELEKMKNIARDLAKMPDSDERRQKEKELKDKLKEMADFAKNSMNSAAGQNALQKALEQLNMAQLMDEITPEMMKELMEQMDLAGMEMQQNAQNMRDMKALEKAMQAAQKAQQANQQGGKGLDGAECEACENAKAGEGKGKAGGEGQGQGGENEGMSMEEYEAFYQEMLAKGEGQGQGQPGDGGGMQGAGTGEGGQAPENPNQDNAFKEEKSKSSLQAGRILMAWETKEKAMKGKVDESFDDTLEKVKQGVSEAIVQERVPPGYHDSIQQYFDSIQPPVEGDAPAADPAIRQPLPLEVPPQD
jgi:hypothetical protein